jgi:hypothetical protein
MKETSKFKTDRLIKICGWLFIAQASLIAVVLILKLTFIPIDSLVADDLSTGDPILIVGLFFIGKGVLNKKEWIRGLAVWILGLRLIVGLPYSLLAQTNYPTWGIIVDAIINICLLVILVRPNIKQQFTEETANQSSEPTCITPVE